MQYQLCTVQLIVPSTLSFMLNLSFCQLHFGQLMYPPCINTDFQDYVTVGSAFYNMTANLILD